MATSFFPVLMGAMLTVAVGVEAQQGSADGGAVPGSEGFSHALWDQALSDHVDERGMVDYAAIAGDDRYKECIRQLAQADPSKLSSDAKKAFWINAYNAMAINGAITIMPAEPEKRREFSVLSFKTPEDQSGKAFFEGLRFLVGVGGRGYTLDEIEKKVLFRQWGEINPQEIRGYARVAPYRGDPRLHFALVRCARGCPVLAKKAYTAEDIEAQLDQAARRFFNDPDRSQFDLDKKLWRVSQLLEWYGGDFTSAANEPNARSLLEFASRYVTDSKVANSLGSEKWRIEYLPYDWRLNIQ